MNIALEVFDDSLGGFHRACEFSKLIHYGFGR